MAANGGRQLLRDSDIFRRRQIGDDKNGVASRAETSHQHSSIRFAKNFFIARVRQIRFRNQHGNSAIAIQQDDVRESLSLKNARVRFVKLNFIGCLDNLFFGENFVQRRGDGFVQIFIESPVFFGGFR